MMPIPANILQRIEEFHEHQKTGQICLNFAAGVILSADIREHVRHRVQKVLAKAEKSQ